jgi:hypothetical protein
MFMVTVVGSQPGHPSTGAWWAVGVSRLHLSRAAGNISDTVTVRLTSPFHFSPNLRPQVSHANPIRCYKYLAFHPLDLIQLPRFVVFV